MKLIRVMVVANLSRKRSLRCRCPYLASLPSRIQLIDCQRTAEADALSDVEGFLVPHRAVFDPTAEDLSAQRLYWAPSQNISGCEWPSEP
jgi:hypothetical protein